MSVKGWMLAAHACYGKGQRAGGGRGGSGSKRGGTEIYEKWEKRRQEMDS